MVPCFIIVKQIRTQFFKQDGDGTISVRELGSVLKSIGLEPEPQQLQRLIDIADTDKACNLSSTLHLCQIKYSFEVNSSCT